MKKLLYLFLTLLIVACSDDDSNNSNNNSNNASLITPPAWIQGVWLLENSGTPFEVGFEFRTDDICQISGSSSIYCYKEQTEAFEDAGAFTNVEQVITSTFYSVEITWISGTYVFDGFEKISDTQISYPVNGDNRTFTKQ
jgi:hypothetical protein